MSFVIHGSTGAQGRPLHSKLVAAGKDVLASGGEGHVADFTSVESLTLAYRGSEGVFVHLPLGDEEDRLTYARNVVEAVKAARPARVVVSTSGSVVDDPSSPLHSPDTSAIMTLINGIRESGVSYAIVAPRLYLENLLLPVVSGPVRDEGVLRYPVRDDFKVSWSSHLDIADVAERLLLDHSVTGVVGVGSLPGLLPQELAAGLGEALNKDVRFTAITPSEFGTLLEPLFGPAAQGVAGLYEALSHMPENLIASDTSAQILLGLEPRSIAQWAKDVQS